VRTSISIPDDVFVEAERLARSRNESRSQLYSRAVWEFIARHSPERVTAALNVVCADVPAADDALASAAARHALRRSGW